METDCSCMRAIRAGGFKLASGAPRVPTVFAVACTVRVDHILYYTRGEDDDSGRDCKRSMLQPIATLVPQCPLGHWVGVVPFLTLMQRMKAYALKGEAGSVARVISFLLALVLLPLVLTLYIPFLVHFLDRKKQCERLTWALAEWGSDHLPVTVCMQLSSPWVETCPEIRACGMQRRRRCVAEHKEMLQKGLVLARDLNMYA